MSRQVVALPQMATSPQRPPVLLSLPSPRGLLPTAQSELAPQSLFMIQHWGQGQEGRGTSFLFRNVSQKSHTAYVFTSHWPEQSHGPPPMQGRLGNGISREVPCIQLKRGGFLVPKGRRGVWVLGAYKASPVLTEAMG